MAVAGLSIVLTVNQRNGLRDRHFLLGTSFVYLSNPART
jgi:hypothetical protein